MYLKNQVKNTIYFSKKYYHFFENLKNDTNAI